MTRFKRLFSRAQRLALNLPVLGVLLRAARNYVLHQSGNQAGSMAFSMVLSMFPLLLLLSAAAPTSARRAMRRPWLAASRSTRHHWCEAPSSR